MKMNPRSVFSKLFSVEEGLKILFISGGTFTYKNVYRP
jgi:hypothetical protein